MNTFSTSVDTEKTPNVALQAAIAILTNNGFQIIKRNELGACLIGPGLHSTNQNPLLGASKIDLRLEGYQLRLDAELGGADKMQRFLMRFPPLLSLALGLSFGVGGGFLFGQQFGVGFGVPWAEDYQWLIVVMMVTILPLAPWLFLSPMLSKMIRTRTEQALTILVRNAAYSCAG